MSLFIIWVVCGITAAMIGSRKGAGFSGFLLGALLGPLGILIVIFMNGNREALQLSLSVSQTIGGDSIRAKSQ